MNRAPVAGAEKANARNRDAQTRQRATCAITGKVVLITFFEEIAANGLKTPRSLRGETHSAGAARPQTLSQGTELLQLCRENVRKVQGKQKS